MALQLITEPDTWEVVLHQVASVLAVEQANQRALAVAAGRTDDELALYEWDVFEDPDGSEISEESGDGCIVAVTPTSLTPLPGTTWAKQRFTGSFGVIVFAWGVYPAYVRRAHAVARQCRQILCSAMNLGLGLPRGTIDSQRIGNIAFSHHCGEQFVHAGYRVEMRFSVNLAESAEQPTGPIFEGLDATIIRASDGRVLATFSKDIS